MHRLRAIYITHPLFSPYRNVESILPRWWGVLSSKVVLVQLYLQKMVVRVEQPWAI